MSDTAEIGTITPTVRRSSKRRKIVFVAEQFVPPIYDGSTYVYKNWLEFLSEHYELYAILFSFLPGDTTEAERFLRERCRAHLILPGGPRSRAWKVLRAVSRWTTGTLFAARWIEEYGRADIHRTVAEFIAQHDPDVFLISKLLSIPLFGQDNIRRSKGTFLLDMHDDFVMRDERERTVLADLLTKYSELKVFPYLRHIRYRHLLSRLVVDRARMQERRLYGLFGCVLPSSLQDHEFYKSTCGDAVRFEYLGWPPSQPDTLEPRGTGADHQPRFDAGFIGGLHPFNVEALIYFCTRILPIIRRHRPDFKFLIAGHVSVPVARLNVSWPGVELQGHLPDAMSFYEQVRVSVVPILSGTGVSVKSLQGLELGKPVVSTPVGVRGLDVARYPNLVVADKVEDFAKHVLALSSGIGADPKLSIRSQALSAGPALAEFRVAFESLMQSLEYDQLLAR